MTTAIAAQKAQQARAGRAKTPGISGKDVQVPLDRRKISAWHCMLTPFARIDRAIQDIGEGVAREHESGREQCDADEQGRIPTQPCGYCSLAKTGIREHLLDEDRRRLRLLPRRRIAA